MAPPPAVFCLLLSVEPRIAPKQYTAISHVPGFRLALVVHVCRLVVVGTGVRVADDDGDLAVPWLIVSSGWRTHW